MQTAIASQVNWLCMSERNG